MPDLSPPLIRRDTDPRHRRGRPSKSSDSRLRATSNLLLIMESEKLKKATSSPICEVLNTLRRKLMQSNKRQQVAARIRRKPVDSEMRGHPPRNSSGSSGCRNQNCGFFAAGWLSFFGSSSSSSSWSFSMASWAASRTGRRRILKRLLESVDNRLRVGPDLADREDNLFADVVIGVFDCLDQGSQGTGMVRDQARRWRTRRRAARS